MNKTQGQDLVNLRPWAPFGIQEVSLWNYGIAPLDLLYSLTHIYENVKIYIALYLFIRSQIASFYTHFTYNTGNQIFTLRNWKLQQYILKERENKSTSKNVKILTSFPNHRLFPTIVSRFRTLFWQVRHPLIWSKF